MTTKKCNKCGREISSQGYKRHVTYCDGSGILKKERPKSENGKAFWKGKKLSKSHILNIKNTLQKKYDNGEQLGFRKWMNEHPEEHKKTSAKGGGARKGSGRGKKGWYKGFWCASSWELAFVIFNLEMNNKIKKNKKFFEYQYNGKTYKYYPDFILNNEYVEIKGYENDKAKEKKEQFPYKLNTYYYEEMKPILEYVISKYGADFTKLYERHIPAHPDKM